MNYLESTKVLIDNKTLHELVSEIYHKLLKPDTSDDWEDISRKINILYETKEMNPPYYFSLEFTFGTYMPFLAPLIMSVLQTSFRYFKEKRN